MLNIATTLLLATSPFPGGTNSTGLSFPKPKVSIFAMGSSTGYGLTGTSLSWDEIGGGFRFGALLYKGGSFSSVSSPGGSDGSGYSGGLFELGWRKDLGFGTFDFSVITGKAFESPENGSYPVIIPGPGY